MSLSSNVHVLGVSPSNVVQLLTTEKLGPAFVTTSQGRWTSVYPRLSSPSADEAPSRGLAVEISAKFRAPVLTLLFSDRHFRYDAYVGGRVRDSYDSAEKFSDPHVATLFKYFAPVVSREKATDVLANHRTRSRAIAEEFLTNWHQRRKDLREHLKAEHGRGASGQSEAAFREALRTFDDHSGRMQMPPTEPVPGEELASEIAQILGFEDFRATADYDAIERGDAARIVVRHVD